VGAWIGRLIKGREFLKAYLAEHSKLEVGDLPYREDVLDYLRESRSQGRRVILATASDRRLAERVAGHLGMFDGVIASEPGVNAKGTRKLELIQRDAGGGGFEYLGDSAADVVIYESASRYAVVGGSAPTLATKPPWTRFGSDEGFGATLRSVVRLMRPHQWVKNVLVLVPVIAGQRLLEAQTVGWAVLAAAIFSVLASCVYVFNDMLDVGSDRRHPRKRLRPLASGRVSLPLAGGVGLGLLGAAALACALWMTPSFIVTASVYFLLSSVYSVSLKKKLLVDVICLAALYTLRIIAGGAATGIVVSPWLFAFSMFVFLSLAFAKRYTELAAVSGTGDGDEVGTGQRLGGRGYYPVDLSMIRSVGPTAGYLSVLVLALYVSAPEVSQHYKSPSILFGICPVMLYWLTRVWFLAQRRELHDDPIVFALKDRNSYLAAGLSGLLLLCAKFL
jgi:4-hydroxybenzoate polyprenyltransferase